MIHHPVLASIGTPHKTCMTDTVRHLQCILVKDAAFVVLSPVLVIHWVRADELEEAEAVVAVVGARGGVDDEVLAGGRVDELLGSFVGGEIVVEGPAVGGSFPGIVGNA